MVTVQVLSGWEETWEKMWARERGMMPARSVRTRSRMPIVYVLPVPV